MKRNNSLLSPSSGARVVRLLCMALMLCAGLSAEARSVVATGLRDNTFYYRVYDDQTAEIIGLYSGVAAPEVPYSAEIATSGTYKGKYYKVTSIANDAFSSSSTYLVFGSSTQKCYNAALVAYPTKITGGGALESIGTNALGNLPNLTEVDLGGGESIYTKANLAPLKTRLVTLGFKGTLPESVCESFPKLTTVKANSGGTAIGKAAFKNCTALKSFTSNYCPRTIGDEAFRGCTALTTFTINKEWGENLTSIGNYAFYGCSALPTLEEGIIFSQFTGLETIGDYAFANALTRHPKTTYAYIQVELAGSKLTSIGAHAFDGVARLRDLTLPPTLKTIGEYAFAGCESCEMGRDFFTGCTALATIGKYAFSGWGKGAFTKYADLTNSKLTAISEGAFRESSIYSVKLPASVTTIGSYAFAENPNLGVFESPCTSLTIGDHAFYKTKLSSFDFTHVLNIGAYAFASTQFTEIVLPSSYTSLPEGIFMDCGALTSFDASASNVKNIGAHAFDGCYRLATVKFNPSYFKGIGGYAFANTLKAKSSGGYYNTKLTITGYQNVSSIGSYAFANSAVNNFNWPSQISTLPVGVFAGSKQLSRVILPEGVENVATLATKDSAAFSYCGNLKRVEIPSTMKKLGSTFRGSHVDTLIVYSTACESTLQCWIEKEGNSGYETKGRAFVPYSAISTYRSPTGGGYLLRSFDVYGLAPTSVTLDKTQATIRRGKSVTVSVKSVSPSDASPVMYWYERNGDRCYERTDADGTFYTNSPSITLKGTMAGESTFTPQAESYYRDQPRAKATFKLTVLEPDTVQFDQEEITLAIGKTTKQTAKVMPLSECDQTIYSWTTSDPSVCTVAEDGTVTARNSGSAIITADTPGRGASGHYTVNVPALKNDIDKSTVVLKPGESTKLNASVYGATVTWKSDNETVATVDQQGNVRAVGEGVANIITSIPEDVNSHAKCMVIVTTEKVMYVGGIYYTTVDGDGSSARVTNLAFGKEGYYGPTDNRDEYKSIITIPQQITYDGQTYNVTEVGDYAFYRMQDLQQVNVPASVVRIGNRAFEGCENLVLVTFATGSRLKTIGYNAFKGCSKLASLDIPNGVDAIGNAAFMDCIALEYMTFPSALVTELSQDICRNCTAMTKVKLSGVKVIGKSAFRDCKKLATIEYNGTSLKMIDEEAFRGCATLAAVTLPSGVASIQNNAYEACTALKSFVFPATVEGIGALCFKGCTALQSVDFKGTTTISFGESVFRGCSALNKVNVASTSAWAQHYFANLGANPLAQAHHLYLNGTEVTSVSLPSTSTYVGQYAFAGANSISQLTLPASVKAISDNIAPSTTTVSKTASTLDLASRNAATELSLDRSSVHLTLGDKITLEADATGTVTWSSDNTSVAVVSNGEVTARAAGTAVITAKVSGREGRCMVVVGTEKPVYVGAVYYSLTEDKTAVVTNLGQGDAMSYGPDTKRTEYNGILSIPAAVTYKGESYPVSEVGMQAFYQMEHLQKVIISASVKAVRLKAFESSKNLARVEFATGTQCTDIAQRAFYGCSKLDEVVLPNALTMLNRELFRKCEGLKKITLPSSLTTVGEWAMAECVTLPGLTLPAKVASLENSAFSGCSKLASLTFPASVEGVGALCFQDCAALQSVDFKVTRPISIGESAFKGCTAMNKVTVANLAAWVQSYFATPWSNPTTLAHNLYVGSAKQQGVVTIPSTATFVGQYALSGCGSITGVTLPASVTAYSDGILRGCGGSAVNKAASTLNLATREDGTYLELDRKSVVAMPGENFTIMPDAATSATWESSNTAVATVTSAGKVTVVGMGTAVITAKAAGKTGKCMIVSTATSPAYVGAYYYKVNSNGTASLTNMAGNGAVAFGTERYEYSGIVSIPASMTYDGKTYPVSEVAGSAFYKMAHLQKAIVPASITTIGSQAFESSERMKRIEFATGSKLTSILNRAFYECKTLDHVVLPVGITIINEATFRYCEALTDITLPAKLTNINEYAFANCTALQQIQLPTTLSAIQDFGFAFDNKLQRLQFHEVLQGIGKQTFQDCTALTNLHFKNKVVMTVGENAFSGCTGLKRVDVDDLDRWVESMFTNEKSNPLYYAKTIGQGGVELTSVKVPSAGFVNQFVFINCQKLTSVDLPATVKTVSDHIFLGCSALESVTCRATTVPRFIGTRSTNDMKSVFDKATLYVPSAQIGSYQANPYWKLYHAISAFVEPVLGDADGNGKLEKADIPAIVDHILGKKAAISFGGADANNDGKVSIGDVTKAIKMLKK